MAAVHVAQQEIHASAEAVENRTHVIRHPVEADAEMLRVRHTSPRNRKLLRIRANSGLADKANALCFSRTTGASYRFVKRIDEVEGIVRSRGTTFDTGWTS